MREQVQTLNARMANLIRVGSIVEVDYSKARARVDLGQSITAWLPWLTLMAGKTSSWLPPEVNEQVIVLAPSGQLNQGMILTGLYHDNATPPSDASQEFVMQFSDGTRISHQTDTKKTSILSTGQISIDAVDAIIIESANTVNLKSTNVTISAESITLKGESIAFNTENASFNGNINASGIISAKNI